MKKLFSLLSVLTISGTAIPTTIAASPYQKEETIKNSDINYQQTNNLESLNRNKRNIDNSKNYNFIFNDVIFPKFRFYIYPNFGAVVLLNKIYFIANNNYIRIYDIENENYSDFINFGNIEIRNIFSWKNNLFIYSKDGKIYKYNFETLEKELIISFPENFSFSIPPKNIINENKVYFFSSTSSWIIEFNIETNEFKQILISPTNEIHFNSGIEMNNKLYFITNNGNIYKYDPENLGEIKNYPIKYINKINEEINNVSLIKINNNVYINDNYKKIYKYNLKNNESIIFLDNLNNFNSKFIFFNKINNEVYLFDENGIINKYKNEDVVLNIEKQIKAGLYFYYKKQNNNFRIKDISNINLDNLIVSDISLKRKKMDIKHLLRVKI
ncbi:PQQ-binding-like beta-propeller repeat protein [Spiroplasma endosymbiont of Megaselia nigra]|uniref:PQQ-binding-like beta-propeller repeat protein n=1 Tax=Spiroplasma endosymbiont of Megaselia nigra TaxID=2478537 RepID=UPI000F883340|nr:PQQ-binding-like beta-propeller repeat protein [Spiroplasma endosymbiont of Megaselia nigra]RUO85817.1 hypothetical protein D9R21_06600 [Spiroplasma endosymbiont of Megaselia nigra]